MALDPKKLFGVTPRDPVSAVARQALLSRGHWVAVYLPLASWYWQWDEEFVHQLRVSTRRAVATVDLFEELLPPRMAKLVRLTLKQWRRAAGPARELDVFLQRVPVMLRSLSPKRIALAQTMLLALRDAEQQPLSKLMEKNELHKYHRALHDLVQKTSWRGSGSEPTWHVFARCALERQLQEWLTSRQALWDTRPEIAHLDRFHRFRVLGKQLRYTLELAETALEQRYPQELYAYLVQSQDRLGELNDAIVALRQIGQWQRQARSVENRGIWEELERVYRAQVERECKQFQRWWRAEGRHAFDAEVRALRNTCRM